jgi:hypothetical protein
MKLLHTMPGARIHKPKPIPAAEFDGNRIVVPRQSLMEFWIAQRIEQNWDSPATRRSVEN